MDMDMGARCGAEVARWPHDLRAVADSAAMRGVSVIGRPVGAVCKLHMTRKSAGQVAHFLTAATAPAVDHLVSDTGTRGRGLLERRGPAALVAKAPLSQRHTRGRAQISRRSQLNEPDPRGLSGSSMRATVWGSHRP